MASVIEALGMGSSMASVPPAPSGRGEPVWDLARMFPVQGQWSEAEYLHAVERAKWLVEFDNGTIEVLPMPTIEHQLIAIHLLVLLRGFVMDRDLGMVLSAPHPTWLGESKYREPDIVFKTRDHLPAAGDKYFRGADLVIEVVSDDDRSQQRDYVEKRELYAKAGVAEYWIVDPQKQRVLVLALDGDKYAEHADLTATGTAASKLLDGFAVDVAGVFAAGKQK